MTHSLPPVLPHAIQRMDEIQSRLVSKKAAVFLDYDGTLAPIVNRPDEGCISDEVRGLVGRLAQCCPTAVVSGRSTERLREFIKSDDVYYAGSHGLDIEGPPRSGIRYDVGKDFKESIDTISDVLVKGISGIQGAMVEQTAYTVAVHYRMVAQVNVELVEAAVDLALREFPTLRKTHGKKIYEIRPSLNWDKGEAVLWLLAAVALDSREILPLYVGDDVTDEDAFRVLKDWGIGVLVSDSPRETGATYRLNDPVDVEEFLVKLICLLERS